MINDLQNISNQLTDLLIKMIGQRELYMSYICNMQIPEDIQQKAGEQYLENERNITDIYTQFELIRKQMMGE